jgi:hypothetical protein
LAKSKFLSSHSFFAMRPSVTREFACAVDVRIFAPLTALTQSSSSGAHTQAASTCLAVKASLASRPEPTLTILISD